MYTSIKKLIVGCLLVVAYSSCNQGQSIQSYIVEKQESQSFSNIDIPTSILSLDQANLTEDQKEAYKSIKKLNFLGYKLEEDNATEYKAELAKVKAILNNEEFKELARFGNNNEGKFVIKYLGTEDEIDEVIILGSSNDKGFAVVRILGKNMKPEKMITLIDAVQSADFDASQFEGIAEFLK